MQQHIAIFKNVVSACLFCPNENVLLISAVGSTVYTGKLHKGTLGQSYSKFLDGSACWHQYSTWHLTFALVGDQKVIFFFIKIICQAPWISQVQTTGLPPIFSQSIGLLCIFQFSLSSKTSISYIFQFDDRCEIGGQKSNCVIVLPLNIIVVYLIQFVKLLIFR